MPDERGRRALPHRRDPHPHRRPAQRGDRRDDDDDHDRVLRRRVLDGVRGRALLGGRRPAVRVDPATSAATAAPATSVDAGKGTLATGSGATGADVVADAKKYLGVPYVFGGTTRSGMDCSGLVQTVFKDLGVTMPRVVPDQADMGVPVGSLADAKPGDLIVPKGEQHIVIYLGDGKVLHAPRPGKDVRIVDNWYKDSDIATIRRIVPSEASATPAVSAGAAASSATDLQTAALLSMMRGGAA